MDHYYPKMKSVESVGDMIDVGIKISDEVREICEQLEIQVPENKDVTHVLQLKAWNECDYETKHSEEQFAFEVMDQEIVLYADAKRAASYGIKTIFDMAKEGILKKGRASDWPAIKRRGIIEGFYGKPWSLRQELDAIRLLWEQRMNTYIYSPKDDVYHREKWGELYPDGALGNLRQLLDQCDKYFIDFYYMLSPGLTMKYSSVEDFERLIAKYKQIYGLGVRHLGLLLDDIQEELIYPEDRDRYGSYGDAHNEICLKTYQALKDLDPEIQFTVCPTIYRGSPKQEYIVNMGRALPEDVSLFWTGAKTCAFDLSEGYSKEFIVHTGHKPFYWDNYPVNDAKMIVEMHLAPIANRDYGLAEHSDGIVANVMEYKEASMLSVISYGHFMWEPHAYDRERSFVLAAQTCLGKACLNAAQIFMNFCYVSCINHGHHVKYSYLLKGDYKANEEAIVRYTMYCLEELTFLKHKCENQEFVNEVTPWLDKSIEFCHILLDYLMKKNPESILKQRIDAYLCDELEVCKYEMQLIKHFLSGEKSCREKECLYER